ncbi:hypothetical protein [Arthrobacter glacialis]|uniref:Uncharacterized protein n=1 Tax=Arthrobacter glacialis TaxID=1664 RepID=A0A2S4A051_ARTGL|nr:hypothetical protein [Arthrobacter glacialis]POH74734.1 hypothetical protein CVS27_02335 [Arthrobacter glacialis]
MADLLGADTAQLCELAKTFSTSAERINVQARIWPPSSSRSPSRAIKTQWNLTGSLTDGNPFDGK